jgi:subtilisin family serine protease
MKSVRRIVAFSLATTLTVGLSGVTSVSASTSTSPVEGSSASYIVVLDDHASLSSAVADERRRGNAVIDTFSAGSDGFVANLDSSDVSRLKRDPDVRIIERDRLVTLDDPTSGSGAADIPVDAVPGDAIPGRYIVTVRSGADAQSLIASFSDRISRRFSEALNGFIVDLSPSEAVALATDPSVASVEQDSVVGLAVDQTGATWGLDRIDQRALPLNQTYSYTSDGSGVTAYIVDTGIRATHSEVSGRVIAGYTAINDGVGTSDCHGHGTHVAGTTGGRTYGVAKNVTFVPVRVLSCAGSGSVSGIVAALDWMIVHHQTSTPAVANMSLGGGYSLALNTAVDRAISDGISFSIAAGNSNADACSYSPASASRAVTVGASTSIDSRASFSNWGSCLDIFAPGQGITSATSTSDTSLGTWSGTSMAAPHVAGAMALYLETNRSASPATVASSIIDAATSNVVTGGGVGSPNRLLFAASFTPAPPTVPSAPTGLSAVAGDGQATVSWNASASASTAPVTQYVVEQSTNGTSWSTAIQVSGSTTSATVAGLVNGVAHQYRVLAVNSVGTSSPSVSVVVTPRRSTAPSAPSQLVATAGRESVSLVWAAPVDNGGATVVDYIVEYSVNSSVWNVFNEGISTARSLTVSGLVGGIAHSFRVRAVNSVGTSDASNEATAIPIAVAVPGTVRFLQAVAGLEMVSLYWSSPIDSGGSAISGYRIEQSTDGGSTYSLVKENNASTRYAALTALTGGVEHLFRVSALNSAGAGAPVVVRATPRAAAVPSAPRFLSGSVGFESVTLSWNSPLSNGGRGIIEYRVEKSDDSGSTWGQVAATTWTHRYVTISPLAGGVPLQFRVVAVNSVGGGAPSNIVTLSPRSISAPSEPRFVSASIGYTTASVSWWSPADNGGSPITEYRVEMNVAGSDSWSSVGATTNTRRFMTVSNLTPNVLHTFRVFAVNARGTSRASQMASVVPRAVGTASAPRNVTAQNVGYSVALSWLPPASRGYASVSDYVIQYSTNNGQSWSTIADGVSTQTSHIVTWLSDAVSTGFRIQAVNSYGGGLYSSTVSIVPNIPPTAPQPPTIESVRAGNASVLVAWRPASDGGAASTYTVQSNPDAKSCTTTGLSCIITGLSNGTTYTFTVTATNAAGSSAPSQESSAVTPQGSGLAPVPAASWGLDRVDERDLPLDGLIARAGSGAGVDAYVIDTGVYAAHEELVGRVIAGFSAVSDGRGTADCDGHGTHVAGTIAGRNVGMAPSARVVPVRVLDCNGSGYLSDVIAGIDWMIGRHTTGTPAVANLSLGAPFVSSTLNDAVARAIADGITVVVAAGNSSTDACGFSPASAPAAITVAATTSSDARASYSNYGACVDIFAPGSSILSADITAPNALVSLSGTSMASPHVAGSAALVLSNMASLSPADVATYLLSEATTNVVTSAGVGTSNKLLYSRSTTLSAASFEDWQDDNFGDDLDDPTPNNDSVTSPDHEVDEQPSELPSAPPSSMTPVIPTPSTTPSSDASPSPGQTVNPDVATESVVVPAVPTNAVVRSATTSSYRSLRVVSVKRRGTKLVVTVASAPSPVRLLRAGRVIASGTGSTFVVSRAAGTITAQVLLPTTAFGGR